MQHRDSETETIRQAIYCTTNTVLSYVDANAEQVPKLPASDAKLTVAFSPG